YSAELGANGSTPAVGFWPLRSSKKPNADKSFGGRGARIASPEMAWALAAQLITNQSAQARADRSRVTARLRPLILRQLDRVGLGQRALVSLDVGIRPPAPWQQHLRDHLQIDEGGAVRLVDIDAVARRHPREIFWNAGNAVPDDIGHRRAGQVGDQLADLAGRLAATLAIAVTVKEHAARHEHVLIVGIVVRI